MKGICISSVFVIILLEAYLKLLFSFFMDIYIHIGYAAQLVGFQFPDQGSNPCHSTESTES